MRMDFIDIYILNGICYFSLFHIFKPICDIMYAGFFAGMISNIISTSLILMNNERMRDNIMREDKGGVYNDD